MNDVAEDTGGSLLSAAAPTEQAPGEQVPEQQAPAANSAPAIERPEWVLDKYANTENPVEEQAKAYVELQKQFGAFTGAPEAYEFTLPEDVEGTIDPEQPMYSEFTEWGKKWNVSNEAAQELFASFTKTQYEQEMAALTDMNAQKEMLGPNADQRISQVVQWIGANTDSKYADTYQTMATTADQLEALEHLISKTRNTPIPNTNDAPPPSGYTLEDYKEAFKDPRYQTDRNFREKHRKMLGTIMPGVE